MKPIFISLSCLEAKPINSIRNAIRCHPCWKPIHLVYTYTRNAKCIQHAPHTHTQHCVLIILLNICMHWYCVCIWYEFELEFEFEYGFLCKLKSIHLSSTFEQYKCVILNRRWHGSRFASEQSYWNTETMYNVPGIVCVPGNYDAWTENTHSAAAIQWNNVPLKCFHVSGLAHTHTHIHPYTYKHTCLSVMAF